MGTGIANARGTARATHQFPVEYHLSVITRHGEEAVFTELRAAVDAGPQGTPPDEVASGCRRAAPNTPANRPQDVLDLYARVKASPGVMNIL